ncbi:glycosyltransferase [Vibrio diabolicus]|nr:glycosyltransferase [Vibrio diabolicus]
MKSLRLFILTNMFPSSNNQKGIFVKELVDVLKSDPCIENVKVFNIDEHYTGFKKYLFSVSSLVRAIRNEDIDVINVHFGLSFIPLFFLLPYLWFNKIKVVLTLHGSDLMGNKLVNFISNLGVLFSDKSIIVSSGMLEYVWAFQRNNAEVIPCGINESFKFINRPEWNRSKRLNIIFPSSPYRPEKNYSLFSNVVKLLKLKNIEVKEVHFDGLDRKQILNALSEANLLFLSSLREGSPQVVKEAVLTGLPVVSTNVGDVIDILDGISSDKAFVSSNSIDIVEWIVNHFKGSSIDINLVDKKKKKYSNIYLSKLIVDKYKEVVFK